MAKATGTIDFSSLPASQSEITIDDGQSNGGFSEVTFRMAGTATGGGEATIFGGAPNASSIVELYNNYTTSKGFFRIAFHINPPGVYTSGMNAEFKKMATGGATPLIYEFGDADGNFVNVTLVNESSGFSANVSGASYSRKDSAGNYSINVNNAGVDADNMAEELKDILTAARSAGEINISAPSRQSTYWLQFSSQDAGDSPMTFRIKRASGSWTSTDTPAATVTTGTSTSVNNIRARLDAPDEVVYAQRHAETGGSGTLSSSDFASYFARMLNGLPLGITATVSGTEVSLENDVDGTSGNITITTSGTTNATISGMSGGAASGGGGGGGSAVAKRLQISAKQIALSGSGGLSGSTDSKSALMLDLAGLSAAAVAQTDVFAFADADASNLPKKISFSDLEDAVFGNISGDATVAAGGALTIADLAVENGMLAGGIASSKLAELDSFDTDDLSEGSSNQYFTQARARGSISVTDAGGDGSMSYDSSTGVITFTGPSASEVRAHLSAVDAGGDGSFSYDSSTGAFTYTGPSAAEVRAHFSGADGIDLSAGAIAVNVDDSSLEISSDALQVKAGGVTNDMLAGSIASTKIAELNAFDSDDLAEGSSNLYFTDARARAAVSVTDAGGDGSLAYDSSTGVITYTGPSASEVRAHFSAGTGVSITDGEVAIGQSVGTSDNVQFADLVLSGDLTVGGTTTVVNSTEVSIADKAIVLAQSASNSDVASASGAGLKIGDESSPLATFLYDGVDSWDLSDHLNLASGQALKINDVLLVDVDGAEKVRSAVAGDGLGHASGVLSVNVDDSSLEIDSDSLQVKALGITNGMLAGSIASSKLAELNAFDSDDLSEGSSNLYFTDARARAAVSVTDNGGDGALSYDSSTGVISYTGPSAAEVRAHFSGAAGIDLSAGAIAVNVDDSSLEISADALQVKALGVTNAMLAGGIASSKLAELNNFDTDDLAEGSSSLYFTDARARAAVSVTDAGGDGSMSYDSSTGVFTYTGPSAAEVRAHMSAGNMIDFSAGEIAVNAAAFSGSWDAALATKDSDDLAEGSANLFFTNARARAAVSVTDAGGDGSLAYNSSTGVITYTGPSAAEVRAHFSGDDGIDLTDGGISVNVDDSSIEISSDALRLKDSGVVTAKIADDAVTAAKLADDIAGNGMQIADGVLSITHVEDRYTNVAVAAGGSLSDLSQDPASDEAVYVFINGLMQSQGTDYTISGKTITLAGGNIIVASDEVVVKYIQQ
jgi:hypothetical protein